jgi:hypothetical protein
MQKDDQHQAGRKSERQQALAALYKKYCVRREVCALMLQGGEAYCPLYMNCKRMLMDCKSCTSLTEQTAGGEACYAA